MTAVVILLGLSGVQQEERTCYNGENQLFSLEKYSTRAEVTALLCHCTRQMWLPVQCLDSGGIVLMQAEEE